MKKAICPGSFDPVTNGHYEIIRRASAMFDRLIVLISVNPSKKTSFTLEERADLLRRVCYDIPNVQIDSCSGLIVDYFREHECDVIVKGLRAVSDFESEFTMSLINKKLNPNLDTMFLCAEEKYMYLSSSAVKELGYYDVELSDFLPAEVIDEFKVRLNARR